MVEFHVFEAVMSSNFYIQNQKMVRKSMLFLDINYIIVVICNQETIFGTIVNAIYSRGSDFNCVVLLTLVLSL